MIITGKHLARRTVLRGMGVTLTLPFLESMVPVALARRKAAPRVLRFCPIYIPMGMQMAQWTPASEGPLTLTPILQPLERHRAQMTVVTGLDNRAADIIDAGPHPRVQTTWLTGVPAKPSESQVEAGVSIDQLVARQWRDTQLPSLELAIEDVEFMGVCAQGYSCIYNNTISWKDAHTPQPMVNNPRAVFERLFGASDSTDPQVRQADLRGDQSILDWLTERLAALTRTLGPGDQRRMDEYLESVRAVETQVQRASETVSADLPMLDKPAGIPSDYAEHVKLMFDLLALAFQTDVTRVGTMLLSREGSVRTFYEIGINEAWHPMSHHGHQPKDMARQAKLNTYHMTLLGHFLDRLAATSDGEASLLDRTIVLYGSGMSDSHEHTPLQLPVLLVGGQDAGLVGGRHVRYATGTPFANLHVSVARKLGVSVDQFADSTGELRGL